MKMSINPLALTATVILAMLCSCNTGVQNRNSPIVIDSITASAATALMPVAADTSAGQMSDGVSDKSLDSSLDIHSYLVASIPVKDYIRVKEEVVIFVLPDSGQIANSKKQEGEENFYIGADDANWYTAQAREYIDARHIKVINMVDGERYIKFEAKAGPLYFDTRCKNSMGWLTIFFRPDSMPRIVTATDIEPDYKDYFEK